MPPKTVEQQRFLQLETRIGTQPCVNCKLPIYQNNLCMSCFFPPEEIHEIFNPHEIETEPLQEKPTVCNLNFKKGIKVGHLNCQEISNKIDEIKLFLNSHKFQFLCCSETWLGNGNLTSNLKIPQYQLLRFDRIGKKGGGQCIYIRDDCTCSEVTLNINFLLYSEIKCFKFKSPYVKLFSVPSIYCPPNINKNPYFDSQEYSLEFICTFHLEVFCLGDFNVNLFLKDGNT